MEIDLKTAAKIKSETRYFLALIIVSLAFGGMAMAFSVAAITNNAMILTSSFNFAFVNLPLIAIGFIVAYLGIRYIISTAEVMDKFDNIQEKTGKNPTREELTSQVVKLMGLYRDEKPQIKRMITISKIAGACFIVYAAIQPLLILFRGGELQVFPLVTGTIVILALGAVGFIIPYFFKKYSVCWDKRLEMGTEVEKKIASFMEENP